MQRPALSSMTAISKTDQATLSDIYHVSEYCAEIERHMQHTEHECQPDPQYMRRHRNNGSEISENNRAVLVDWLLNVHLKFKLLPETLFITVNIIDRYLSNLPKVRHEEI